MLLLYAVLKDRITTQAWPPAREGLRKRIARDTIFHAPTPPPTASASAGRDRPDQLSPAAYDAQANRARRRRRGPARPIAGRSTYFDYRAGLLERLSRRSSARRSTPRRHHAGHQVPLAAAATAASLAASLRRLRAIAFDLLQIHGGSLDRDPPPSILGAADARPDAALRDEGLVAAIRFTPRTNNPRSTR